MQIGNPTGKPVIMKLRSAANVDEAFSGLDEPSVLGPADGLQASVYI